MEIIELIWTKTITFYDVNKTSKQFLEFNLPGFSSGKVVHFQFSTVPGAPLIIEDREFTPGEKLLSQHVNNSTTQDRFYDTDQGSNNRTIGRSMVDSVKLYMLPLINGINGFRVGVPSLPNNASIYGMSRHVTLRKYASGVDIFSNTNITTSFFTTKLDEMLNAQTTEKTVNNFFEDQDVTNISITFQSVDQQTLLLPILRQKFSNAVINSNINNAGITNLVNSENATSDKNYTSGISIRFQGTLKAN